MYIFQKNASKLILTLSFLASFVSISSLLNVPNKAQNSDSDQTLETVWETDGNPGIDARAYLNSNWDNHLS